MNIRNYILVLNCLSIFSCKSQSIDSRGKNIFVVGKINMSNPVIYLKQDSLTDQSLSFIVARDHLESDVKEKTVDKSLCMTGCKFYKLVDGLLINKEKVLGLDDATLKAIRDNCNRNEDLPFLDKEEMIGTVKYSKVNSKRFLLCFFSAQYFLTFLPKETNLLPNSGYVKVIVAY